MEMSEYWGDVNMWRCTDYKTVCTLLDSLKPVNKGPKETNRERVVTINA